MVNPLGSPPRVRGKAEPLAVDGDITGITPACAGKRVFPGTHIPAVWDHPRVCGEKKGLCAADEPRQGSPPRVRGKGGVLTGRVGAQRITPACAGKSKPRRHGSPSAGDHPRVCGEKSYRSRYSGSRMGSPPRVRGKEGYTAESGNSGGITPACAGKSRLSRAARSAVQDHPRVCGEKTKKIPSHRPFQLHPVPVSFSFA